MTSVILVEGSLGTLRICTAPQRERLGAQDPAEDSSGNFKIRRRYSEVAVARVILVEGSSGALQTRTAP